MKKLLAAATGLSVFLALTGVASAADPVVVDPVYDWSGVYIGLVLGGAAVESTVSDESPASGFFDNNNGEDSIEVDNTDFMIAGTLGYNMQFDSLVLGLEGELGYIFVDDTELSLADGNDGDSHSAEYGFYGLAAARAGFAFDRLLPYVKVGVAVADVDYEGGDIDAGGVFDPLFSYEDDKTRVGYAIGGGLEYAITDHVSVKAEYVFIDFGSFTVRDDGGRDYKIDDEVHTFKAGVNFLF